MQAGGHQAPLPLSHRERGREVGGRKCFTSLTIFFTSFLTLVKLGSVGLGLGGGLEGRGSGCVNLGDWSLSHHTCPVLLPEKCWPMGFQGHLRTGHRMEGGWHINGGSPGYYEVILFLFILGKNSKYKIILIKVKIHHLDFVVVL